MKRKNLKKPMISALEQRILFDGAAVATAVDVLDESSFSSNDTKTTTTSNDVTQNNAENSVHEAQAVQGFERDRREVAFVDVTVKDYQTLVDGVNEGVEVYLVSSLDEIKTTLSSQTNIDAIHILSHGNTGEISVGNDLLNSNTLDDNAQLLETMKNSLSVDGDILLYGCNVASDGTGQEFINSIATLTQADVAASEDTTGNSALGGDWVLEKNSGSIETDNFEIMAYDSALLAVSFTGDSGNTNSPNATVANGSQSSISITNTATNDTLNISTTGTNYYQDTATTFSTLGITPLSGGSGMLFYADTNTNFTNSITFTIQGNKVFDFNKILLQEINDETDTFTFTPNGDVSKRVTFSFNKTETKLIDLSSNTNFDGITSLTISTLDNKFQASFDNIEVENIRSASDTTAPTFDVAPATSNVTATTVDLSASLDEAGKIYYVVVADGATAPTVTQIKAGQDSTGASALKSGNSDVTATLFTGTYNITGLSANTAYDIYVVGQDDEGTPNVMASATKVDVTTTTLNITFDFESNVTGFDTTDVRQTVSNETLKVISSTAHMDGAINTGGTQLSGNESLFTASNYINEISTTFSLVSGKTFDLTSLKLKDNLATQETVTITSSKGSATFSINASTLKFFDSSIAGFSNLQGVSSFTVTVANAGNSDDGYGIIFDDIYLTNILDITGPTVSVATGSYTDTAVNDTFTNTTGTISAIASSGSIIGYGINGGTTGGSTDVGGTIYDVSKAGTYGTLYVKSSNGNYVYVPTSDSVINATTSTVTDVFTIQATDGAGTGNGTLTITINGVNDTPVLTAPTSASYIDTSATDTFSNTTGTLSASDRDTGATLSYGINTGTTGGSTLIGGITYDVSKAGTYGILYVVSTGADKGKYAYVATANAINALTSNVTDTFTISSSDGSLSNTQTFTVNITGVNDAPTASDKTITINEDTATVLSVSDFGFSDIDTGSALSSVKITSLASDGTLEYNNGTSWVAVTLNQVILVSDITGNKLRFNPSLNENGTTYATFNFMVNDGTIDSSAKTVTYNVTAVNDTPTVANTITDQNASVSNTFSFVVPLNTFADVDTSDTFTYTAQLVDSSGNLVSGGTLPSWLTFTAGTRTFSGTPALSDTGTIYVKVTATDNGTGTLSVSDTFTITTNSGPTVSVATGSYTDTAVNDTFTNTTGTISATASSGSIIGYGISGGTTGGNTDVGGTIYDVSKAGTYGTLYVKSSNGNYVYVPTSNSVINATTSTVTDVFTIQATDSSGTTGNSLTITINGVNDTPVITSAATATAIDENSGAGQVVYTVTSTDVDASATVTYSLSGIDASLFTIDSTTGAVTLTANPNFETKSSYSFNVIATDNGTLTDTKAVTLAINNVNEAPVITSAATATAIDENSGAGQVVYTVTSTDVDASATVTYSLSGIDASLFTIDSTTGAVTLTANPNFETKSSYSFNVIATDNGTLTDTKAVTLAINNVNDAPEGTVSISGTVTQGQTLTASNNITDADGMGTISYQWYADGVLINGAVNSTYTLTQNEVNKAITVVASYTDGFGANETVTSSATTSVVNVNHAPVGTVTISGTVTQGQTLTASNNITDADGMGTVSYQWFANGVEISGATGSTYTLTQNEVNKAITVVASYTDALGTAETVTSSATTSVTNVNDAPEGTVSISGTVTQGQTLTASNNITDADGMGTISYQWYADGVLINGAVNSTYTLTQNEVNKAITVVASYTDGFGANETVTSSATASVVNVNHAPTVSNDNIDVKLSFGDAYQKDVSGLFSDIDFDNVFTYEAINLPLGLTMNSSTGVISGRANSSGEFKVIIKVTDNGTPALSVSRTYNMLVVAPPQVEISQNTSPKPSVDNTPIVNVNNITISTFTDTLSLGTINNNLGDTPADSVGNGYIDSNRENNNQENNNQPLQVNRTNSSNYIEANASLNVGFNGQISFDNTAQDSFSIVGIAIENMTIENNRLEIRVVDTNLAQNFIVTQIDGTALPTGLSFDPKTGNISGTIPENLDKLEITIKATNPDGTTRVLNLKLDLKELKKAQKNQVDADEKYMGLKEQIALENQKLDDYGSYLTRLFA